MTSPMARTASYVMVGAAAGAFAATRWAMGRTGALITDLADRGAVEQARARRRAAAAGADLMHAIAVNPVMNRVVDAQLERTVRPLVSIVLDDVLALLDDEPERIRTLIRGQRQSIADDLINRVRNGAVAADTRVDRMAGRLLRYRGERPVPPGPLQPEPAPVPAVRRAVPVAPVPSAP